MSNLEPELIELLEGKNFASFVTLLSDGSPHAAPTWIDHEGDTILVNTALGRQRKKTLEKTQELPYQFTIMKIHTTWQQLEAK